MRKFAALILPVLLLLSVGFVACGKTPGTASSSSTTPANQVDMGQDNFVQTTRTVKSGDTVIFKDSSDGAPHVICVGTNGQCNASDATGTLPTELKAPGFNINPGESKNVTFTAPGTYKVTCTIHPQMNMTITVQ